MIEKVPVDEIQSEEEGEKRQDRMHDERCDKNHLADLDRRRRMRTRVTHA